MDMKTEDPDIAIYRDLMPEPTVFEDGFNIKAVIGAFFVGCVMLPGSIYLGLMAGASMGPASTWVTVILFTEIARRSFKPLSRQEIYVLLYIAGGMIGGVTMTALGGPFGALIWNQYLTTSPVAEAFGIADQIPNWVSPSKQQLAEFGRRSFLSWMWVPAVSLIILSQVFARMSWFGMGYVLFRLTSDREKLPFPLAPIAAAGATALAEDPEGKERWRWNTFSVGMVLGIVFGMFYIGIPAITGLIAAEPIHLIPIPWIDLTNKTERFLPAVPLGIMTDLGIVLIGMVLPFRVVLGTAAAALVAIILNPILYHMGILTMWKPGMETIKTQFVNSVDFWMSIGIGLGFAVAAVGIYKAISETLAKRRERGAQKVETRPVSAPPPGRGDFPLWVAMGLYIFSAAGYVVLCMILLRPKEGTEFPLAFLLIFAFLITPLISYISARLVATAGQEIGFPMVKEAAIFSSGYKGVDIWFVHLPYDNFGAQAQHFRSVELTGTKFTSIIKAELLLLPLTVVFSFIFWSVLWRMNPIPSNAFPYAQKIWELQALNQCIWLSSTTEGNALFTRAITPLYITIGFGGGVLAFSVLSWLGLPLLFVYGFVRGIGGLPHSAIPELVGALIGRYYFTKRFGAKQWRQYVPIIFAGYGCGLGLVSMLAVSLALIAKSVAPGAY